MNSELMHYGILGMKWGIRRTPEQLGHTSGLKKKKQKLSVDDMSDAELQKAINRLRMEEEYTRYTKKTQSDPNPSKKIINDALAKLATKTFDSAIDKIFSKKQANVDLADIRDEDPLDLDADTVSRLAKYWEHIDDITKAQKKYNQTS